MPETNNIENNQAMQFDAIQIGLASPEKIREWLKVMRKNNVSIIFATQNLEDVANSKIAPAIIESCLTRIFLPNPAAINDSNKEIYKKFDLNNLSNKSGF